MANLKDIILRAEDAYGTDDRLLRAVNQFENSGRLTFDVNNWDSNARAGTPSAGPFQFIKPTFDGFARHARDANPGAWRGVPLDWKNPQAQALAASWAFANGKGSHWATYGRAQRAAKGMKDWTGTFTPKPAKSPAESLTAPPESTPVGPDRKAMAMSFIFGDDPVMQSILSARQSMPVAAPDPAPVKAAAPRVGAIGKDYRWIQEMGQKLFGLKNDAGSSQTTGGRHVNGSEHYSGRAVDFGDAKNSRAQLNAWKAWAKRQGLDVLDEGNHVHVSLPGSGT